MTAPDFSEAAIPEDFVPTIEPDEVSNDPTCEVCGIALHYGGRGRKPKFCDTHRARPATPRGTARVSSDVDSALVILGGMYDGLCAGLMFVSPQAASVWQARSTDLQSSNRVTLSADKKLCQRINNLGKTGGSFAFLAAHVIALAPVVQIVRHELSEKAAQKKADEPLFVPDFNETTIPHVTPPNKDFFS